MRGDLKAAILHLNETEGMKPLEISQVTGCDIDYARIVLRIHRGYEDPRSALPGVDAHNDHLMSIARANAGRGFVALDIPPAYRVRA